MANTSYSQLILTIISMTVRRAIHAGQQYCFALLMIIRYVAIVYPVRYQNGRRKKIIRFIPALIILCVLIVYSLFHYKKGIRKCIQEKNQIWYYFITRGQPNSLYVNALLYIILLIPPILVLGFGIKSIILMKNMHDHNSHHINIKNKSPIATLGVTIAQTSTTKCEGSYKSNIVLLIYYFIGIIPDLLYLSLEKYFDNSGTVRSYEMRQFMNGLLVFDFVYFLYATILPIYFDANIYKTFFHKALIILKLKKSREISPL